MEQEKSVCGLFEVSLATEVTATVVKSLCGGWGERGTDLQRPDRDDPLAAGRQLSSQCGTARAWRPARLKSGSRSVHRSSAEVMIKPVSSV